ncbi:hypothetical protein NYQ66_18685 [Aquibacillus koreensis]|nr:hypothetical protein [Aquibacillus koreensis]MCT2537767.1 hypothetical protein [Aquibacillus koreensis]
MFELVNLSTYELVATNVKRTYTFFGRRLKGLRLYLGEKPVNV